MMNKLDTEMDRNLPVRYATGQTESLWAILQHTKMELERNGARQPWIQEECSENSFSCLIWDKDEMEN